MKKTSRIILLLTLFSLPFSLFAGDQSEVWTRLYRRAISFEQKEMILNNIVKLDDRAFEPVLIEALEEMNGDLQKFRGDVVLMMQWIKMTRMIVKELGELKSLDAEDQIFFVATHTDDSLLVADALIALGNIRSVKYAPEVATILRNLNFNTQQINRDNAEIEAYGAVMALQKMREPIGFEPVFYSYIGWYSKRTKNLAGEALKYITEDPTEPILAIVKEADYDVKKTALFVEKESSAPADNKNKIAVLALEEGLKYQTADKIEQDELSKLRIEAMKVLIENKANDDAASPFLSEIIKRDYDVNETLYSLYALGVIGSDKAVDILSTRLALFNKRQQEGITASQKELGYIKQIIKSIGMSGNKSGSGVLAEVQFSDYTPAINRLARESAN
ncbi:MAG: hypothetical protein B6241_00675 [Spirochaetaceae bacterium 4572_59]|nr:MAG: hypothetical protein B6241_00675 [Spirochaetaceae bacterium 4572_59]